MNIMVIHREAGYICDEKGKGMKAHEVLASEYDRFNHPEKLS